MSHNPDHHSVRRIVLPSGRSIDVVRFDDAERISRRGLHICPQCDCDLVQPIAWSEAAENEWELLLGCPNCSWSLDGIYRQDELQELEERLDEGLAAMLRDLQRLTHANMAEEIDRFVSALHAGLILPEDF